MKNIILSLGILAIISCKSKTNEHPANAGMKTDAVENQSDIKYDSIVYPADTDNAPSSPKPEVLEEKAKAEKGNQSQKLEKKVIPAKTEKATPKQKPKTKKTKPAAGKLEFDETKYDFGEIKAGDVIEHKFEFKNIGKVAIDVVNASATCGCTVPSYPFLPIEPGETGFIGVQYNSVGKEGDQEPVITVFTNGQPQLYKLKMTGKVTK